MKLPNSRLGRPSKKIHKCRMCPETDPSQFQVQRKNGREYPYFLCKRCRREYLGLYRKEKRLHGKANIFARECYTMLYDPTGDFRPTRNVVEVGIVQMESDLRFFVYEDGTRFARGRDSYIVRDGRLVQE